MRRTKLQTAESLARAHSEVDPNLRRVYLIDPLDEQNPEDPIKLLEVVDGTIERGVEPIAFPADPARGFEYPSVIVEVSPAEYEAMRRDGNLGYDGWTIGRELLVR